MYSNIGKKIKVMAMIMGWVLLIAGLILAYLKLIENSYMGDDTLGWIGLVVGVISLISSWPLYAFGQLVEDTNAIRKQFVAEKTTEESERAE